MTQHERFEGRASLRGSTIAEMPMQQAQRPQLDCGDRTVIDERIVPHTLQPRLKFDVTNHRDRLAARSEILNRFDVDIQHVEKAARRRPVRARGIRTRQMARMQRIEPDQRRAGCCRHARQCSEIGEIADPPIAR